MVKKSGYRRFQEYFMPVDLNLSIDQIKHYSFFATSTLCACSFLIISALIDLNINIKVGGIINLAAFTILMANLLFAKKIKKINFSFIVFISTVVVTLFIHQSLSSHFYLHNYIWPPIIPLIMPRYIGAKKNIYFTILIIFFLATGIVVSNSIPHSWHYQLPVNHANIFDVLSLFLFTAFSIIIGNHLLSIEKRTNRSLDAKNKENGHLISILTHDISNQVTVINLACNKLSKNIQDQISITSLDKIKNRVKNIERLIAGIRNSQQALDSIVQLTSISMIDLFEDITTNFEHHFKHNDIKLIFEYDNTFDYYVTADKKLLLDNAIMPVINATVGLTSKSNSNHNIILKLQISNKKIKLLIMSNSLQLFNSPLLSNINATTLAEKEAVLAVVLAKKVIGKFEGNVEISPSRTTSDTNAIIFSFPKKGIISL